MDQRSDVLPVPAIDFSELHAHHSRSQLRAFRHWAKSNRPGLVQKSDLTESVLVVLIIGGGLVTVAASTLMIGFGVIVAVMSGRIEWITGVLVGLGVAAFIVFSSMRLIEIWRRDVRFGVRWRRWMRLNSFAEANHMVYTPEIVSPDYPGSLFMMGKARRARDIVATSTGRYVEIGNYQYSGQTGLNRSLNRRGYIRVILDRRVPHLYLRSRKSRKLGETFARSQEFALEGDFGQYFRLYAPGGYERDALYILTPDLMALLIDEAANFDVEFVGSNIFFYSPRRFRMTDPQTFLLSIRLGESVVAKALKQTGSYSDARSVGGYVHSRGARLSRGMSVAAMIGILIAIAQIFRLVQLLFLR
ncbi:hypothetical protein [Salinibacterium sp.]|uniref:hypothetical protein n=1 Tax=Salinibacterium sp. TaxID=1915057 RepID=UPI00286C6BBA|nr:hypothetical protein [Salinibacterium sp.]